MTRGQVTKNKQNGQQKQDFFGKKHELTICVGIALFGVLPTLSHAQNFITSDKITHPIPNNMMGHAPTPATITQETTKVEPNSTDNDLTTFATNTAQITSSSPDIIPPNPFIHPQAWTPHLSTMRASVKTIMPTHKKAKVLPNLPNIITPSQAQADMWHAVTGFGFCPKGRI